MTDIIKSAEDAWLGLDKDELELVNPLLNRDPKDIKRPDMHLLRLIRQPRYLGFACKVLFNIELLPVLESFGLAPSLCLLLVVVLVSRG